MKIDRVNYQKTFSIGPYLTDKVGIEAQVEAGETPELVLTTLKTITEEWHISQNKSLYGNDAAQNSKQVSLVIDDEFEAVKKSIEECDTKEKALDFLSRTTFRLNIDLKKIANSKPSNQS